MRIYIGLILFTGFWFWKIAALAQVSAGAYDIHAAIIEAHKGEIIQIPAGHYNLAKTLTLSHENLTLAGAGKGKTVLDFSGVSEGGQGILLRASGIAVESLTVLNSPGDGLVARGVENIVLRDLEVRWRGRAAGGYGIYPVQARNVVVERVTAVGAQEAGIYVGQTMGAHIVGNTAYHNVIGIDVENSSSVLVQGNNVFANSIGIAVTGRPYLFGGNSQRVRLAANEIKGNNLRNFAPSGSFVKGLGSGIGIVVTAVRDVVMEGNNFQTHDRSDIAAINFDALGVVYKSDPYFDPFLRNVKLRNNLYEATKPKVRIQKAYIEHQVDASHLLFLGFENAEVQPKLVCFSELDNTLAALSDVAYYIFDSILDCNQNP